MNKLCVVFLSLLLLLLNSCIEGDEEIFYNENGSARLKAVYSVSRLILGDKEALDMHKTIERDLGSNDQFKLLTNTLEKIKGKQVITIEIETEDLLKLENLLPKGDDEEEDKSSSNELLEALLGNVTFRREGLGVGITRDVDLSPLLEKYLNGRSSSILGGSEFRYALHFPQAVNTSNAHEVSSDGKTLRWRYQLSEYEEIPIQLSVVSPIPLPWWVYALLAVIVLVSLWGAWMLIRRWRRS